MTTRASLGERVVFADEIAAAEAFRSTRRVDGLTHQFYRYPARFSPEFVRHVIAEFSKQGDTVLDPFMGGGTTIVEALAAGRRAIGMDINGLAHFVTSVKTTPLSNRDVCELRKWSMSLDLCSLATIDPARDSHDPRMVNLPESIGDVLQTVLGTIHRVRFPRQRQFARCILLRVGQWALESKHGLPNAAQIQAKIRQETESMLDGLAEFVQAASKGGVHKNKITDHRLLLQASVTDSTKWLGRVKHRPPHLVVTSPPYPGVHVLYHRWQVSGRRETPAPYWVASLRDGHGASHYTMGSRSTMGLKNYFSNLHRGFRNLSAVISPETLVVQLVAFSESATQLPMYLDTLKAAGYQQVALPESLRAGRTVPHRKWYTQGQPSEDASQEVLMIHRLNT